MDMPMSSGSHSKIEIITGVQRRKRWTPEQKLAWVRRTTEPGMSVSLAAREACISSGQLFHWRKAYLEGSLVAVRTSEPVAPGSELQEAMGWPRASLERSSATMLILHIGPMHKR
jgi:transposase